MCEAFMFKCEACVNISCVVYTSGKCEKLSCVKLSCLVYECEKVGIFKSQVGKGVMLYYFQKEGGSLASYLAHHLGWCRCHRCLGVIGWGSLLAKECSDA